VALVRLLVAPPISADVNLRCAPARFTALHFAVDVGTLEMVELVLAAGADPAATTEGDEWSVLHLVRDAKMLRRLLQLGLPLECRDAGGSTPLQHACCNSGLECVEALLAAGADIHATENRGWGVLHCSAFLNESEELIHLLLDHATARSRPLNVNAPDKYGTTPLMTASASCVDPVIVEALLAAGADVSAVDIKGWTALHHVGRPEVDGSEFEQVYQLLINAGGDVFALNNNNVTPPQMAFERHADDEEVMPLMTEQVAQVPKLRAELASISTNLQTLIVGAAAEIRRVDHARAGQQQRELEWARKEEALAQRVAECERRERKLSLHRRLA